MASIFLDRHGQYRRSDPQPGAKPETFDALAAFYCSTLQRALETAEIVRVADPGIEIV